MGKDRTLYLPPPPEEMFPHFLPDKADLERHLSNTVTKEFLSRAHRLIYSQEGRLSDATDANDFSGRKGFVRGLREALSLLETIAAEIAQGTADNEEETN